MLGKQAVLGTACQAHSSGKKSCEQWPSVLVRPMQNHSCFLFRLSKQDPARLSDLWTSLVLSQLIADYACVSDIAKQGLHNKIFW